MGYDVPDIYSCTLYMLLYACNALGLAYGAGVHAVSCMRSVMRTAEQASVWAATALRGMVPYVGGTLDVAEGSNNFEP